MKEVAADFAFETLDRGGERRLGDAAGLRRAGETAVLADREEIADLLQFHAEKFSREGRSIKYLRSTFVPDSGCCSCLFEAQDAATVEALNDAAKIPYNRVAPAFDLQR